VDGDRVAIDVDVGRGATAFLSTQASTKVYRSPHGTSADLNCRVAAGGLAIVAPDPVVCFAGAGYRQHQRFDVADDGALVAIDCIVSGRRAAGERWAFVDYRSRLEVTVGERLIVHDSMALRAADGELARRLGRFNALAVIVIAGTALRTEARRLIAESSRQAVARRADQIMTVMPIGDDGCIVRIAGVSSEHVGCKMRETVQFIPQRLGDDPWARKW
jgi:urease accessory protein